MSPMLAFLPNQLRRSTRSLRGSATTSSRKTEKFRVNPYTVYARAFAVLAAEPYVKQGFHVREDYWPGDLAPGERKAIRQQLFKGNEYWFWLGTEVDHAKVSVHIYNSDGKLADQPDSWAKDHFAAAHIIPKTTSTYFIIVSVEKSPAAHTHWALGYGFR